MATRGLEVTMSRMERIDVSEDRRMADLVAAVERGEEVLIVRDGAVVAEVRGAPGRRHFDMSALEDLRASVPLRIDDATTLVREMRDADNH